MRVVTRTVRSRTARGVLVAAGLTAGLLVALQAPTGAQTGRVVAIGDIHGAAGQVRALLQTLELIDSEDRWVGGDATLVQTGDFTDRGAGVKLVLDLLMDLEAGASDAGGRVVVLLGNHEAMNLTGNLRDTTPQLLAPFATRESETRREEAYEAYVSLHKERAKVLGPLGQPLVTRDAWMQAHPLGFIEYLEAFGPKGSYGRWLRGKPVVAKVGDSILLHGGLRPDGPTDLDAINAQVRRELETFDRARAALIDLGVLLPFSTYQELIAAVQQELIAWLTLVSPTGPPGPDPPPTLSDDDLRIVQALLELQQLGSWSLYDPEGPIWFRGYARWEDDEGLEPMRRLTAQLGVARIIVGHTIPPTRLITSRFENRVFLIDTGMLTAHYSGQAAALDIEGDRVTAVYLDRRVPLTAP